MTLKNIKYPETKTSLNYRNALNKRPLKGKNPSINAPLYKSPPRMNSPPPPTVSEEDITEAAPFFNIFEEDDVENDIDID